MFVSQQFSPVELSSVGWMMLVIRLVQSQSHVAVFVIAFDTMLLPLIQKCNIFSLPTLELMVLNSVHASHSCVSCQCTMIECVVVKF
jgi:hypothetical protein